MKPQTISTLLVLMMLASTLFSQDTTETKKRNYFPQRLLHLSLDLQSGYHIDYDKDISRIGSDRIFYAENYSFLPRSLYVYATTSNWHRLDQAESFSGSSHTGLAYDLEGLVMLHAGYGFRYGTEVDQQAAIGLTLIEQNSIFVQMFYEVDLDNREGQRDQRLYLNTEWSTQAFVSKPLPDWAAALYIQFAFRSDYGLIYGLQYDIGKLVTTLDQQLILAIRRTEHDGQNGILVGLNYRAYK